MANAQPKTWAERNLPTFLKPIRAYQKRKHEKLERKKRKRENQKEQERRQNAIETLMEGVTQGVLQKVKDGMAAGAKVTSFYNTDTPDGYTARNCGLLNLAKDTNTLEYLLEHDASLSIGGYYHGCTTTKKMGDWIDEADPTRATFYNTQINAPEKDIKIITYVQARIDEIAAPYSYTSALSAEAKTEIRRLQKFAAPSLARTRVYNKMFISSNKRANDLSFTRKAYDEKTGAEIREPLGQIKALSLGEVSGLNMSEIMAPEILEGKLALPGHEDKAIRLHGDADAIDAALCLQGEVLEQTRQSYTKRSLDPDEERRLQESAQEKYGDHISRLYAYDREGKMLETLPILRQVFNPHAVRGKEIELHPVVWLPTAATADDTFANRLAASSPLRIGAGTETKQSAMEESYEPAPVFSTASPPTRMRA